MRRGGLSVFLAIFAIQSYITGLLLDGRTNDCCLIAGQTNAA
jgi:hypothetical protein